MLHDGSIVIKGGNKRYDITVNDHEIHVGGTMNVVIKGDCNINVDGTYTVTSKGDMKFNAPRIDFN